MIIPRATYERSIKDALKRMISESSDVQLQTNKQLCEETLTKIMEAYNTLISLVNNVSELNEETKSLVHENKTYKNLLKHLNENMTYSDVANMDDEDEDRIIISKARVLKLMKQHGHDEDSPEFKSLFDELGDHETYDATKVLQLLGY